MGLKHIMVCEPLELEYVAAGLAGHDVRIFDMIVEHGLERRLRDFCPHIVGTSCYITGVNEVKKLCRTVKRWDPACLTIVGGVHASLVPEDFTDSSVDCIALGDGTALMREIVAAHAEGRALSGIPGLAFPTAAGHLARSPEREYMGPPDDLPLPRRELVAHLQHRYFYLFHQPVVTIKTTWGCWYSCNFCFTWRITGGHAYSRSPESIAAELETIAAEDIYIVDDIFLINRSRLARLAKLLRERGIRKKFLVYGRADFIARNEDVIEEWAGLGLTAVLIGLEASTNSELDSMNKQSTVNYNIQAIDILRRNGVDVYGSLIPGPDYTAEDWDRLWQFIDDNGLYYLNISPLTPLPGTAIWSQYESQLTVPRSAHSLFDLSHCLLPTRMPLKEYYRRLLGLYMRACLDIRRANRLTLRTRPPIWSRKYFRLWLGALRMYLQLRRAYRHHDPRELARGPDLGVDPPASAWLRPPGGPSAYAVTRQPEGVSP
jgi:radical SAM superfamily enzyme YgiQ (UPF0313 family)